MHTPDILKNKKSTLLMCTCEPCLGTWPVCELNDIQTDAKTMCSTCVVYISNVVHILNCLVIYA